MVDSRFSKLRFMGACPWPGRQYYSPTGGGHSAFDLLSTPAVAFHTSPSGSAAGPFVLAHPSTVVLPDIDAAFNASFPLRGGNALQAATNASAAFERFVRDTGQTSVPALSLVSVDCGFFSQSVFDAIRLGNILTMDGVPSENRIANSLSVYSFLRFRQGVEVPARLPEGGWSHIDDAQRFLASIQWFITYLFGAAVGQAAFMFRALTFLRDKLSNPTLHHAWQSMDKRSFSMVIVQSVQDLWIALLHWEEAAAQMPLYYQQDSSVVTVGGAAPFPSSSPTASIDVALAQWCATLELRFPPGQMAQANSFTDVIPRDWEHIFLRHGTPEAGLSRYGPLDGGQQPPRRNLPGGGNGDDQQSRAYRMSIFEKVATHPDCSRTRGRDFSAAVRPFPSFLTASGESIELCFGYACMGMRCARGTCQKPHLSVRSTWDAPRSAWENTRQWLSRPAVADRVRLTPEAQRIPGLRL